MLQNLCVIFIREMDDFVTSVVFGCNLSRRFPRPLNVNPIKDVMKFSSGISPRYQQRKLRISLKYNKTKTRRFATQRCYNVER